MSELSDYINLTSIYTGNKDENYSFLYQLLAEREDYESISHVGMPTWQQHMTFIERHPYKFWGLIVQGEGNLVGSIYLTFSNEIGISISKKHRRLGYARAAIKKLMDNNKDETFFVANINPRNQKSIDLFDRLGFRLIQQTYKIYTEKVNPDDVH